MPLGNEAHTKVMTPRTYWKILLLFIGITSSQIVVADGLVDRKWQLVTSPNFRVHAVLSEERTVGV